MKDELIKFLNIKDYEEFDKYLITKSTNAKGQPVCQIYNTNCKKLFNARVEGFYFHSEEAREKHINEFKTRISEISNWKNDRKAAQKSFVNPAKVGDILNSSWGYEQTNIDFYQVIEIKGKFVTIRQIAQNKEQGQYFMQGTCMPKKDVFIGEPFAKLVKQHYTDRGYLVNINSFAVATLWDGKPQHWTAYA